MKKQTWIELGYLLLIVIAGFFMLNQTSNLAIFDDMAEQQMKSFLMVDITNKLLLEGKSKDAAKEIAEKKVAELMENEAVIGRVKTLASNLKELHKDENGQVYPYRVDSYLFIRKAQHYINHGRWGVEKQGETSDIDPLRHYPLNLTPSEFDIVSYFFVISYRLVNVFHELDLLTIVFYLPLIFGLLSLILIYFIAKKINGSSYLAFVSCFFISLNHRFFVGTFAGNADSQFLFSFMIMFIIFLYLHMIDSFRKFIILFFPTGLLFYLLKISWSGWIYLLGVIFPHVFFYGFYLLYKKFNLNKKSIFILFVFAIFFSLLVVKPQNHFERVKYYLFKSEKTELLELNLISETKPYTFKEFLYAIGGYEEFPLRGFLIFLFTLISYFLILNKNVKSPDKNHLLILLWFSLSLLMSLKAKRFSLYMAPSHGVVIGLGISLLAERFYRIKKYFFQKNVLKFFVKIALPLLIILVSAKMVEQAKEFIPEMNDAIFNAGEFIKKTTSTDTPIINWWDKGYLWQYASERPTISDGASGGTDYQRNFILANALLSDNDNISTNLFNILVCDNMGEVFDLIRFKNHNLRYPTRYVLGNVLKQKNIVIKYHGLLNENDFILEDHCPEKNYTVAISEDLLYKITAFSSIIKWDDAVEQAKNLLISTKNMTEKEIFKNAYGIITENDLKEILNQMTDVNKKLKNVNFSDLFECKYLNKLNVLCSNIVKINLHQITAQVISRDDLSLPKSILFNSRLIYKANHSASNTSLIIFSAKTLNDDRYVDKSYYYYYFIDSDYAKTNFVNLINTFYVDKISQANSKSNFLKVKDSKNRTVLYKLGAFVNVVPIDLSYLKSKYIVHMLINNTHESILRKYYDVLAEKEFEELISEIKNFNKQTENVPVSKILDCQSDGASEEILCNNIKIDTASGEVKGPVKPNNLVFVKRGKLIEKIYDDHSIDNSLVVFENKGKYGYFFIDPKYSKSTLVKLITGADIKGLKKVYTANEPAIVNVYKSEQIESDIYEDY